MTHYPLDPCIVHLEKLSYNVNATLKKDNAVQFNRNIMKFQNFSKVQISDLTLTNNTLSPEYFSIIIHMK